MSDDPDKMRSLVAFRKRIQLRVEELDAELKEMQNVLEAVNSILVEKGFKRVEIKPGAMSGKASAQDERAEALETERLQVQTEAETENIVSLKSVDGEILADTYVTDDSLHVVPAKDKSFDINTPPFNQFLLQRILLKMQERDSELSKSGQLPPEKILCFDIVRDGDIIREIVIRNFDSNRLRELKSSIRWTFEKMLEKTRS